RQRQFAGWMFPILFRLHKVEPLALARALNTVIQRHAALRMAYGPSIRYSGPDRVMQLSFFVRTGLFVPGLYTQRLMPMARLDVRERELRSAAEIDQVIADELSRPLDITRAPQMRATMIRIDTGEQLLVLGMSHLAVDGWSMGVFSREFVSIYEADVRGVVSSLPTVDVHSPDFAVWQQRQFRAGGFEPEEHYWRHQWATLDGAGIRHGDIPFAVSVPGMNMSQLRLVLGTTESAAIQVLLARLPATPYTFFRTVMTIVLHYQTGKRRVAFWANFANRRQRAFAQMIGWCANTHVVIVEVTPEATCAELCRQVATAVSDAQAHEGLPLPALWQRLGRVLDTHDSRINFDLLPKQKPHDREASLEPVTSVSLRNSDLDIRMQESMEGFTFVATFNSHRYRPEGVEAMLASMHRVAARLVDAPGSSVSDCARLVST
ncbi:MAG TPA: condensation domain-containing protein, partial [Gemmatimonadales bacterium]|nr:condensation domain-containing protein [Gemmatimonadales bacterium]